MTYTCRYSVTFSNSSLNIHTRAQIVQLVIKYLINIQWQIVYNLCSIRFAFCNNSSSGFTDLNIFSKVPMLSTVLYELTFWIYDRQKKNTTVLRSYKDYSYNINVTIFITQMGFGEFWNISQSENINGPTVMINFQINKNHCLVNKFQMICFKKGNLRYWAKKLWEVKMDGHTDICKTQCGRGINKFYC
jgi:hypothetical protein